MRVLCSSNFAGWWISVIRVFVGMAYGPLKLPLILRMPTVAEGVVLHDAHAETTLSATDSQLETTC